MPKPSKDMLVLAVGQALTGTVTSLLTSVSSLSGALLAPSPPFSTLPVTATVLGTLLMIYPASALMGRLGRRGGFMFKAGVGVVGGAVCALGLVAASFSVLVLSCSPLQVAGKTIPLLVRQAVQHGRPWAGLEARS
jgi:MFS family permease